MENWNTRKSLLVRASDPEDHEAFEEFVYYYKNFINMVFGKLGVAESQIGDLRQKNFGRTLKINYSLAFFYFCFTSGKSLSFKHIFSKKFALSYQNTFHF